MFNTWGKSLGLTLVLKGNLPMERLQIHHGVLNCSVNTPHAHVFCFLPFQFQTQSCPPMLLLPCLFSCLLIELLTLSQDHTTNSVATDGFQLSTERRAKERQDFEREKSEREALRALQEQERLREQEEQDREKVARLRHELVSLSKWTVWVFVRRNMVSLKALCL